MSLRNRRGSGSHRLWHLLLTGSFHELFPTHSGDGLGAAPGWSVPSATAIALRGQAAGSGSCGFKGAPPLTRAHPVCRLLATIGICPLAAISGYPELARAALCTAMRSGAE
jgi:hypothetical protein